jgi:hypothetical protein
LLELSGAIETAKARAGYEHEKLPNLSGNVRKQ